MWAFPAPPVPPDGAPPPPPIAMRKLYRISRLEDQRPEVREGVSAFEIQEQKYLDLTSELRRTFDQRSTLKKTTDTITITITWVP